MTEGEVVLILGQQDDRVREVTDDIKYGTIIFVTQDEVFVLLLDTTIWRGPKWQVKVQNAQ